MTELLHRSLSELRAGLDKGEFSSRELVSTSLDKIEKNKDLNAYITVCRDEALKEAAAAEIEIKKGAGKTRPLLGIPVSIKDLILTKDIKTTCASKMLANFIPPYDATVTKKLKESGAVIVGKTNMDEFAMGSSNENSFFGPVRNPWNKECIPGGSSGGSAAAVAARLTPLSLGSDTGGSIRQPASLSGIVGVKPTYGRVSRYGVIAFASSLDQIGVFANTVEDAALGIQVLSGHDPKDSTSVTEAVPDFVAASKGSISGLRIGIPKEYFIEGLNSEVENCIRESLKVLEKLGAKLVQISLPHTEVALSTYYIIAPAEASSNLARYDGCRYGYRAENPKDLLDQYCRTRAEGFGDEVKRRIMIGSYVLSSGYFDAYYLKAQKVRALVARDFTNAFAKDCDVIACPVSPSTAFKIGEKSSDPLAMYLSDVFTIPASLAGLPGMSVPCGFDSKGLPIGLHLISKPFDEVTLFKTGRCYESASDFMNACPKGF
ncbi:MAG: Asp-tRNA(Asn)/Glu-tRNA(Gln) amidotransferase subunit GatA [bacterium]|nr:Asp-tRNA(Asn)/Glu-tRNA(Gln) amidotransferase subunit GatA [bacterium]